VIIATEILLDVGGHAFIVGDWCGAGRVVLEQQEAGRRRVVVGEPEADAVAWVSEQSPAGTDDGWGDHEPELVDETGGEQGAAKAGTSVDLQLSSGL
jgi:hypothetical protein